MRPWLLVIKTLAGGTSGMDSRCPCWHGALLLAARLRSCSVPRLMLSPAHWSLGEASPQRSKGLLSPQIPDQLASPHLPNCLSVGQKALSIHTPGPLAPGTPIGLPVQPLHLAQGQC